MVFQVDVRLEAAAFKRGLSDLEKRQLPFATALALTSTAFEIRQNTIRRMGRVFDRPTRHTLKGVSVVKATKTTLQALVGFGFPGGSGSRGEALFLDDSPHAYLLPQEYGGKRPAKRFEKRLRAIGVMRPDEFAVPAKGFRLNAYGNIPAARFVQILSQLKAFNDAGYDANETSRSRKRAGAGRARYFAVRSTGNRPTRLPPGIYERRANNKVKGVIMFVKQPVYRAVLGFRDGAAKTARARLPVNLRRAMDRAIATAKLK